MKKLAQVFAMFAMSVCLVLPAQTFKAAEKTAWVVVDNTKDSKVVTAEINTNGSTCDGVIQLKYDADALKVTEKDVTISDEVEMYSINVAESGVIAVSYLSEKTIKKGAIVTVTFAKEKDFSMDSFELTASMFNAQGKELTDVQKKAEVVKVVSDNTNTSGTTSDKKDKEDKEEVTESNQTTVTDTSNNNKTEKKDDKTTDAGEVESEVTEATEKEEAPQEVVEDTKDTEKDSAVDEKADKASDDSEEDEDSNHFMVAFIILLAAILCLSAAVILKRKNRK